MKNLIRKALDAFLKSLDHGEVWAREMGHFLVSPAGWLIVFVCGLSAMAGIAVSALPLTSATVLAASINILFLALIWTSHLAVWKNLSLPHSIGASLRETQPFILLGLIVILGIGFFVKAVLTVLVSLSGPEGGGRVSSQLPAAKLAQGLQKELDEIPERRRRLYPDGHTRRVRAALRHLRPEQAHQLPETLWQQLLEHHEPMIREEVVRVLKQLDEWGFSSEFLSHLLQHPDKTLRQQAIRLSHKQGGARDHGKPPAKHIL